MLPRGKRGVTAATALHVAVRAAMPYGVWASPYAVINDLCNENTFTENGNEVGCLVDEE